MLYIFWFFSLAVILFTKTFKKLFFKGLRAANSDLNKQLTLERTEEKRRIFELAKGKHLAISHKHRPSGESRKSTNGGGTNGGGTNGGKINGGRVVDDDEEDDGGGNEGKKEDSKNGKNGHPSFFTNGTAKTNGVRKSWHGGTGGSGGGGDQVGGTDKDFLLTPFLTSKRRSPILRQYSVVFFNSKV